MNSSADFEADSPLALVNREYFAVLEGSKIVFCREEADGALTYMDKAAFLFHHGATFIKVGMTQKGVEVREPLGVAWMKWQDRRYYPGGFTIAPGGCRPDQHNLWKGFGVEPAPGDWSLMKRHIAEVICDRDAGLADYVTKWCAWKVQNPLQRPLVALVLRGEEGTGKGFFCGALAKLFGKHSTRVNQAEQVVGRFNAAMRGALLVWCDEIYWSSNNAHIGRLKGQITEELISIERKGIDPVVEPNYAAFLFSTNADWAIPAGKEARRFVVCNVADRKMQNNPYFAALAAESERGGLAAMLHDLLAMPLGDFHPDRNRFRGGALDEQKAETLRRSQTFPGLWLEMLEAGTLPTGSPRKDGAVVVLTARMLEQLKDVQRKEWVNHKSIATAFAAMEFEQVRQSDGRGWLIPPLAEARGKFCNVYFPVEWQAAKEGDQWEIVGRPPF